MFQSEEKTEAKICYHCIELCGVRGTYFGKSHIILTFFHICSKNRIYQFYFKECVYTYVSNFRLLSSNSHNSMLSFPITTVQLNIN